MTLIPLVALMLLEGALRLIGFGYPSTFFLPAIGGAVTTNPKFAWQFYGRGQASSPTPLIFQKAKPAGTKRVFVLGESAAAGTPDPAFSFSRMLELMFEEQGERVEIINAAMRGIDSHIVRHIADDCARYSPDLFIIYMGNNEAIGRHSPSPKEGTWYKTPGLIRFGHGVKRAKLAQVFEKAARTFAKDKPPQTQEMLREQRMAFDDPKREVVYQNFRANLDAICDIAARAGAKVIVSSVAVNLRDFPPLESMHRTGLSAAQLDEWSKAYHAGDKAEWNKQYDEALKHFRAAAQIDDHHAELLYRIARCEEVLGQLADARTHYALARDWDALQFRTDCKLNGIARDIAKQRSKDGVRFVDAEVAFAASSLAMNGVCGEKLFQEHVHFLFEGDHLLATTLLPSVRAALGLNTATKPSLDGDECARRLAYTPIEAANILSAVEQMTGKPPFLDQLEHGSRHALLQRRAQDAMRSVTVADIQQAKAIYHAALARRPDDWMLHYNYARLLGDVREDAAALPEYERVAKLFPHQRTLRFSFGVALMKVRRVADAAAEFTAVLKSDPEFAPARQALAAATGQVR
jgi:tetratricopeptide (TPR) repeat protein